MRAAGLTRSELNTGKNKISKTTPCTVEAAREGQLDTSGKSAAFLQHSATL
jgi:hypothetical protein